MNPDVVLHPQLRTDCHLLGRLPASQLLLHRNALLPWFILVPETRTQDFLALPEGQRNALTAQCSQLAELIRSEFAVEKINVASIGNLVPQMHLHVVGRYAGDACWPKPVWGNLPEGPGYDGQQLGRIAAALGRQFGQQFRQLPDDGQPGD
jgi:diadenosine tetraphosphate (Ap4A) HIT family hydrolase